nr:V-set and immunoglobulin domain-containing protein 8-like [Lonchura striata domestica]
MAGHGASLLLLLGLLPALLVAVRINGHQGREVLYLAKGDSVKLGCPYVLEPEDVGPQGVGIEWIQITPERPGPENVFLSYHDHHVNYGSSGLQDRVAFVQTDPGQRDASIRVADLQESDTGTYQCRVKKNTVAVHEVIVTVQEKPAAPQCWSEGELLEGGSVLLRCFSRGGAAPLSYQWAKLAEGYGGGRLPAGTLQVSAGRGWHLGDSATRAVPGRAPGDLVIRSLTVAHAGTYQCRVSNRVGYSVCQLSLNPGPRGRQAGIIVGSILGSLLLLSLLGLLIWALIARYQRKECQRACSDCSPPTPFIADARGHLLPGVPRSQVSPWGTFLGTWDMPARIPPARWDRSARSAAAAARLARYRHRELRAACNGVQTRVTGKLQKPWDTEPSGKELGGPSGGSPHSPETPDPGDIPEGGPCPQNLSEWGPCPLNTPEWGPCPLNPPEGGSCPQNLSEWGPCPLNPPKIPPGGDPVP